MLISAILYKAMLTVLKYKHKNFELYHAKIKGILYFKFQWRNVYTPTLEETFTFQTLVSSFHFFLLICTPTVTVNSCTHYWLSYYIFSWKRKTNKTQLRMKPVKCLFVLTFNVIDYKSSRFSWKLSRVHKIHKYTRTEIRKTKFIDMLWCIWQQIIAKLLNILRRWLLRPIITISFEWHIQPLIFISKLSLKQRCDVNGNHQSL